MSEAVTTPEVVEEVTNDTVEEVATEETQAVEERTYANKYKSVDELEKGYGELQKLYNTKLKGFTGAPEDGVYNLSPADGVDADTFEAIKSTPTIQKLIDRGLAAGMNNNTLNGIVNDYISTEVEMQKAQLATEMEKLGKDADRRIESLSLQLKAQLADDEFQALSTVFTTAASIEAMEKVINKGKNQVAPIGTQPASEDELAKIKEMFLAKDEFGRDKMMNPDYAKVVNAKWAKAKGL